MPNGLGLGAFYWEPTWTVVKGNGWDPADPASGDGWENQAMFDDNDKALPVVADYAARQPGPPGRPARGTGRSRCPRPRRSQRAHRRAVHNQHTDGPTGEGATV